jgi:hypothetical protein
MVIALPKGYPRVLLSPAGDSGARNTLAIALRDTQHSRRVRRRRFVRLEGAAARRLIGRRRWHDDAPRATVDAGSRRHIGEGR